LRPKAVPRDGDGERGEGDTDADQAIGADRRGGPLAHRGDDRIVHPAGDELPQALTDERPEEEDRIGAVRQPDGEQGHGDGHDPTGPEDERPPHLRGGEGAPDTVAKGDVPGLEDLDVGHHLVGESERGGDVRQPFEREGDLALRLVFGTTPRTRREMRLERVHAEPLLAIEEEVDLFRE
jgi:hypothetical protein